MRSAYYSDGLQKDVEEENEQSENCCCGEMERMADEIAGMQAEIVRVRRLDSKAFAAWKKREAAISERADTLQAQVAELREALRGWVDHAQNDKALMGHSKLMDVSHKALGKVEWRG